MLDMWVIFVNISPVIGLVIHEEKGTRMSTNAPTFTPASLWMVSMVSRPRTADG